MSPNVGNFVHDLVEMAKAMETLPLVQAELAEVQGELAHRSDVIQRLELKLMDRDDEINALHAKLREAEVAKDAAETMFLEADDRTARALDFIKATFGNAGSLIQALEPPKPQPTPEPVPMQAVPEAPPVAEVVPVATSHPWDTPTGVEAELHTPMHEAQLEGSYFKPEPEPELTAAPASAPAEPSGPYAGIAWSDAVPRVWSKDQWLSGGGTEESWVA